LKLPSLKDKSKIKEGEHLSSLGRAKEISIKERHNKSQCQKKKGKAINMTFGIHYKASDVIR
jgi:hypothetical protein